MFSCCVRNKISTTINLIKLQNIIIRSKSRFRMSESKSNNNGNNNYGISPNDSVILNQPTFSASIESCHTKACNQGENTYIDPQTGYTVFTSLSHLQRGVCCGSQCRHCPFGHYKVDNPTKGQRINKIYSITLLRNLKPKQSAQDNASKSSINVLVWNADLASYLTLLQLNDNKSNEPKIILLTLFNPQTYTLTSNSTHFHTAMDQSLMLKLDLLAVPIDDKHQLLDQMKSAVKLINLNNSSSKVRLIFNASDASDIDNLQSIYGKEFECIFPLKDLSPQQLQSLRQQCEQNKVQQLKLE